MMCAPANYKAPHPVHVSTTNIEYNNKSGKVEVICTIFTDDFEATLAKQSHVKTDLSQQAMHKEMDVLVSKYLSEHLQIKTGGLPLKLNYLGYEINKEATDVYLESDKIPAFKKVNVNDKLLYDMFDDQMNIVHIIINGVRKSERLNYPATKLTQEF